MSIPMAWGDILDSDDRLVGLAGGGSVLVVSEVVGLILPLQGDSAEILFD